MFSLRLLRVTESWDLDHAGTLRIMGTGGFALVCEGP